MTVSVENMLKIGITKRLEYSFRKMIFGDIEPIILTCKNTCISLSYMSKQKNVDNHVTE